MDQAANFIKVAVSGGHNDSETTISVSDASAFPNPALGEYNVTWFDGTNYPDPADDPNVEIVRVTARDTGANTLTVTRAQESTPASTKNTAGATYYLIRAFTAKDHGDLAVEEQVDSASFGALGDDSLIPLVNSSILVKKSWLNFKASIISYLRGVTSSLLRNHDGWQDANEEWTYSSVDDPTGVITVPSDATTKYSVGMRIKFTNNSQIVYGIITAVTSTSITFLHEIDPSDSQALHLMQNSAITNPYFSPQKAPFGFPLDPDKWSVEVTNYSEQIQASPSDGTWYNNGSISINIPIGVWDVSYGVTIGLLGADENTFTSLQVTLSTGTSTESNSNLTAGTRHRAKHDTDDEDFFDSVRTEDVLSLSTKDTYYLNIKYSGGTVSNILFENQIHPCIIRAVCAYL